jgi:hypothetical protein
MSVQRTSGKTLDLLIRCLHRYVELNPERFKVHREGGQKGVVVTVLVAEEKPPR